MDISRVDWRSLFRGQKATPPGVDPCAGLAQHLVEALNPFMGDNKASFAPRLLHGVGPHALINIDMRLRAYSSSAYGNWSPATLRDIASCPMPLEARQSLLFVACSHRSGLEREKAVLQLAQFPGFLTLAAALIRSADWVPQVKSAARDAVSQLLKTCAVEDVISAWPIVLRLQQRERSSDGWLSETAERWMSGSLDGDRLRRARSAADEPVRIWAYRQSIERGEMSLLPEALMQSNPRIGLHALRHAKGVLDAKSLAALASAGLDAPNPAVRRECLRALASADPPAALGILPRALLDRSAGVRRLAAYLTRQGGADPRNVWRAALGRPSVGIPLGALASLAEEAEGQDESLLRGFLFAVQQAVRQQALRGLFRTERSLSPEEISRLLSLGGRQVMAALSHAICDSNISLDPESVLRMLADKRANDIGRANLCQLIQIGGLWIHIERLLMLHVPDSHHPWWLSAIDGWIERSEAYAPLGEVRKSRLLQLTSRRAVDLGAERVSTIEGVIARH